MIAISGPGRRFYALDWPSVDDLLVLGSITAVSILVFEAVLAVLRRCDIHLLESVESEAASSAAG